MPNTVEIHLKERLHAAKKRIFEKDNGIQLQETEERTPRNEQRTACCDCSQSGWDSKKEKTKEISVEDFLSLENLRFIMISECNKEVGSSPCFNRGYFKGFKYGVDMVCELVSNNIKADEAGNAELIAQIKKLQSHSKIA